MRRLLAVLGALVMLGAACQPASDTEDHTGGVVAVLRSQSGTEWVTHGADALPERTPSETPETVRLEPWPCDTTDDHAAIQWLYLRTEAGRPLSDVRPALEAVAAGVEGTFASATEPEPIVLRYVVEDDCVLSIPELVLSEEDLATFGATIDALEAAGYTSPDRKYHAWVESRTYCGIGTLRGDDSPVDNTNDSNTSYARSDTECWNYAEGHEIIHMLGGVQLSAPNSTGGWHCTDARDVMCYDDGGPTAAQRSVCAVERLDCSADDYFAPLGTASGYLAAHWNVAASRYFTSVTAPPDTTTTSTSTTSTTLPPSTTSSTVIEQTETETDVVVSGQRREVGEDLEATAVVSGECAPEGVVSFYVSGQLIDKVALVSGVATLTLRFAEPGRFSVRGTYEGSPACETSQDTFRPRIYEPN